MNCNLDNFLCIFDENNMPDIFIFTETWYDGYTPNVIPGYSDYHSVRIGVSVYVKIRILHPKLRRKALPMNF